MAYYCHSGCPSLTHEMIVARRRIIGVMLLTPMQLRMRVARMKGHYKSHITPSWHQTLAIYYLRRYSSLEFCLFVDIFHPPFRRQVKSAGFAEVLCLGVSRPDSRQSGTPRPARLEVGTVTNVPSRGNLRDWLLDFWLNPVLGDNQIFFDASHRTEKARCLLERKIKDTAQYECLSNWCESQSPF